MHDGLFKRWRDALEAAGGCADARPIFDALVRAYEAPHRRYHTLAHIEACLAWLDWCWALAERPHEIALALWFHDVVYEPVATDNEAKSAALARETLERASVPEDAIARVEKMVLATRAHDATEGDEALLVDIDLAILGASTRAYARFERDVRDEYRAFDDATYAQGRAHALASLRAREPIYATPAIAEMLAASARKNLDAAIARLSAS